MGEELEGRKTLRDQRLEKYGDWSEDPPEHLVKAEEEKEEADRKLLEAGYDLDAARARDRRAKSSQFRIAKTKKGGFAPLEKRDYVVALVTGLIGGVVLGLLEEPLWVACAFAVAWAAGVFISQIERVRRRVLNEEIERLELLVGAVYAKENVLFEENLLLKKRVGTFESLNDFQISMGKSGVEIVMGGSSMFGGQSKIKLRMPSVQLHQHLVKAMIEGYKHNTRRGGGKLRLVGEAEMKKIVPEFEDIAWKWIDQMMKGQR